MSGGILIVDRPIGQLVIEATQDSPKRVFVAKEQVATLVIVEEKADPTPGTGGGDSGPRGFTFRQDTPQTVWFIRHPLGFQPGSIAMIDSAGDPMSGDPRFPDRDTVTVTFAVPVSGVAYLS